MIEKIIINYNNLYCLVILPVDWLAAGQPEMSNEKGFILHWRAGKTVDFLGHGQLLNLTL